MTLTDEIYLPPKRKRWSMGAMKVIETAYKTASTRLFSDPDWSLLESYLQETPQGIVHLHWTNRKGQGYWKIIKRVRSGAICKTARCRVVTITPHGGENEVADLQRQAFDEARENWMNNLVLDRNLKYQIEESLARERKRRKEIQNIIEEPYGPWIYREWKWDRRNVVKGMILLDKELSQ